MTPEKSDFVHTMIIMVASSTIIYGFVSANTFVCRTNSEVMRSDQRGEC
jgi:hypothetical protein